MNRKSMLFVAIVVSFAMVFGAVSFSMQHVSNGNKTYNFVPNSETGVVSNAISVGPVNQMMHLNVMVTLKFRNQAMLSNLLYELQDPHSPMYHKFLSQSQFTQYFSPTPSEYYGYVAYFLSKGLSVQTYSDRISMTLGGTVSQLESVFHTTISMVKDHGRIFYAPVKELRLSYGLSGDIAGVVGLSNEFKAQIAPLFTGSGSGELLYGADMQAAYQLNKIYAAKGYPTNETIATILWSGTDSAGNSVAPFVPSDISYYFNHNLPSGEPKSTVYGYPIDGAPAPGPSAANDQSQADFESTLDLEMAGSAAPGATIVEVYGPQATQTDLDQAFAAILNPSYNTSVNSALSHVVAISNSWGGSDMVDSTWNQYEQEAAARGITVLASSGDDGDTSNVSPSFPATVGYDTYGTLSVGGAATVLTGTTSTDGSGTTGISTESVWYNTPNSGDGSQGGVSSYYAEPSWQQFSSDANSVITGASSTTGVASGRGTPDVAADGANMEIYITYSGSSGYQELWGTSIASPLTAGIVAVMDYYLGQKEGFMNPLIYRLAQAEYNGSYANAKPFYFISNGSNGAFSANNGYSLAVGWGSINAYNFVLAQTSSTSPPPTTATYSVTFTESGLPSGTTWSVTLGGSTQSGTGSISFSEPNGSYSYTVGSVSGYTSSPSSGTVTVSGASITKAISFTATTTPTQQSMAVAQVNATASNTYTYNLPEAEEITPGSTSLSINYVSLYLSGSGSVDFGIGTSLWGDNVVPFTAVQVNSNEVWYNVSFPAVTLAGGTDYYLTVEGSGSILWGYASYGSTTVDHNALKDYWYSSPPSNGMPSGTPTSDNSYPDLFTVGYYASSTPVSSPSTYPVTFTESGLPSGTTWSVTLGGSTQSGTGSISFSETNGTYSYTVSTSDKSYAPSSYSGTVTVAGSSVTTPITFSEVTYPVTFTESGLPSGTTWSVTLGGSTQSGTGSISFSEPNGSYSYTVGSVSGYTSSPSSGTVTVSGSSTSVSITFSAVSSSVPNGVFAQVNATSSNTYYYTLPEAEEFDVSSTVQVDYVTLNIEGTGTITVGIGTSVFDSNVLANITLSVNVPNGGWINISFPAVTLNSGTNYFLNVNEPSGSGNVQWGYTTSPSVDNNALQDYWYSGSTLVNDNSYPDLFSIGYSSSAAVIAIPHVPGNAPLFTGMTQIKAIIKY
ncbi:MAG: protease pro-enzyme activation domain-containing protein [Candidatus Thermoplasmatota archaeon]|nr:protease pro-enzyme activation domain-containing protein [Candidatus Thermoplasmatota archaeon]MCL5731060.1 protease pro-enzyme activation domain-containing protein [Candidatus Thermoplasmatota archaeon]